MCADELGKFESLCCYKLLSAVFSGVILPLLSFALSWEVFRFFHLLN